uniref:Secreted protein n=1 Tax=Romanomermis culicivorax TaxID=13658 RepID=A0A915HF76_ROMCU
MNHINAVGYCTTLSVGLLVAWWTRNLFLIDYSNNLTVYSQVSDSQVSDFRVNEFPKNVVNRTRTHCVIFDQHYKVIIAALT